MKITLKIKQSLFLTGLITLAACGGGGGGGADAPSTPDLPTIPDVPNIAPTAIAQDHTIDEDTNLNLTLSGTDIDGSIISYNVVTQPTNGTLTGTGANLVYSPTLNFNGNDTLAFTVNDDDGAASSAVNIDINITSVNDSPIITLNDNYNVNENTSATGLFLNTFATDPELDDISISLGQEADSNLFSIDANTTELVFNTIPNFEIPADNNTDNLYQVSVVYTDTAGLSVSKLIDINVIDETDEPNIAPTANAQTHTIDEDTNLNLTLSGTDTDGSIISYNVVTQPTNGTLTGTGANLVYSPTLNFNGNDTLAFTVNDDDGATSSAVNIDINITSVNDSPILTLNDDYNVNENTSATGLFLNTFATDPELDDISISLGQEADSNLFSIDANTTELVFNTIPNFEIPADNDTDNLYQVSVVYTDTAGLSVSKLIDINVIDEADVQMAMVFPTPNSNLGGVNEVTLRGTLTDQEDNQVLSTDIPVLKVNGVEATLTNDNTKWSVTLPVSGQVVNLDFEGLEGNEASSTNTLQLTNVRQPTSIEAPYDGDFDSNNNRLIVVDSSYDAIIAFDTNTFERSIVSDKNNGGGVNFENINGITFDSSNDRAFVSDISLNAVFEVDTSTGDRTIISSDLVGTGVSLISPLDLSYDEDSNQIYLVDIGLNALIKIDVDTGDRIVVSANTIGSGGILNTPSHLALDTVNNTAYIADQGSDVVFKVDLTTGDRTIIVSASVGSGTYLPNSHGVVLSVNKNSLFVIGDSGSSDEFVAILEVDLSTLSRSVLSSSEVGSGVNMNTPRGLVSDGLGDNFWVLDIGAESVYSIDSSTGNREALASPDRDENFLDPTGVVVDTSNKRLLVIDTDALYSIDNSGTNTSGNISVLSNDETGTGPSLNLAKWIAFDQGNNRVFVVSDNDANEEVLLSIDLTTGNRSQVAEFNGFVDNGNVASISFDPTGNRIFFIESNGSDKLVSLDLDTLTFVEISNLLTTENPSLSFTRGLSLNIEQDVAYVIDGIDGLILSVDLSSGVSNIISSESVNSGPTLNNPTSMEYDSLNNRLLVTDLSLEQVITIDLATGNRAALSDSTPSVNLDFTSDLTLDSENKRLFLTDFFEDNIYIIDTETGERAHVTH